MRQLLYVSSSRRGGPPVDIAGILQQSRHNNAIDGVTGLLWTDGVRFLQVLEGADDAVEATFTRISADERHHAIVVLRDRVIDAREFGDWSMAHRDRKTDQDGFDARMARLLDGASAEVRGTFMGLIAARK